MLSVTGLVTIATLNKKPLRLKISDTTNVATKAARIQMPL